MQIKEKNVKYELQARCLLYAKCCILTIFFKMEFRCGTDNDPLHVVDILQESLTYFAMALF